MCLVEDNIDNCWKNEESFRSGRKKVDESFAVFDADKPSEEEVLKRSCS